MVPLSMNHGADANAIPTRFSGREFSAGELDLIREVVASCSGLSRKELAQTVCELLGWKRPSGGLKARECWEFLNRLEGAGLLVLPEKQQRRPVGSRTRVPVTARGDRGRELIGRHHYLGHAVPFGAHLRYLVYASRPERTVVGCVQFSSPAWRMAVRDVWIGWDERARRRNLQRVVSQSRFLIVPWAHVKNLASVALSQAARRLPTDWYRRYRVRGPLLRKLGRTSPNNRAW